ncbi:MAG: hypothetical protein JO246_05585 [Frankiaceae bacterium]|nr:hypothetical protein [Frankiaceae bacterium]
MPVYARSSVALTLLALAITGCTSSHGGSAKTGAMFRSCHPFDRFFVDEQFLVGPGANATSAVIVELNDVAHGLPVKVLAIHESHGFNVLIAGLEAFVEPLDRTSAALTKMSRLNAPELAKAVGVDGRRAALACLSRHGSTRPSKLITHSTLPFNESFCESRRHDCWTLRPAHGPVGTVVHFRGQASQSAESGFNLKGGVAPPSDVYPGICLYVDVEAKRVAIHHNRDDARRVHGQFTVGDQAKCDGRDPPRYVPPGRYWLSPFGRAPVGQFTVTTT